MTQMQHVLPPLPPIGRPETFYAKLAMEADRAGSVHGHEAAKVGQYITLALEETLPWEEKLKYFRHVLRRHCQPPPFPDEDVSAFYESLKNLARQYAGQEALRMASAQDDIYAARLSMGQEREEIEDEAEEFFRNLIGNGEHCPDWINEEDWNQLKLIRDQWI
jgi:hypothetical protein